MTRVSPSRTPEKRREAYLRQRDTVKRWEQARKERPDYARDILASELGLSRSEIPDDLVAARFQQIQLRRAVRDAQVSHVYPVVRARYLAGATVRDLAKEFGFDRDHVAQVITTGGIEIKRRPFCRNGHEMTEANTAYCGRGWRHCRKCACESTKRYYARRKAAK